MRVSIEICHPNEVLENRWTHVDSCEEDEIIQHLQAPTFSWQRGTVVRVPAMTEAETLYGIFGEHECLNVSAQSDWVKNHIQGSRVVQSVMGLPTYWRTHPNGRDLIVTASNLVHDDWTRKTLIAFVEEAFRLVPDLDPLCSEILNSVKSNAKKSYLTILGNKANQRSQEEMDSVGNAYIVFGLASNLAFMNQEYVVSYTYSTFAELQPRTMNIMDRIRVADERMAEIVRETIPFYEIALGITR